MAKGQLPSKFPEMSKSKQNLEALKINGEGNREQENIYQSLGQDPYLQNSKGLKMIIEFKRLEHDYMK